MKSLGHYAFNYGIHYSFTSITNVYSKLVKRQQYYHPKLLILYKVLVQSHLLKAQHGFDHQCVMVQKCKLILYSSRGQKHLIQINVNKRFIQLIDISKQQNNYDRLNYQHRWFTFTAAKLAFMKLMLHSYYSVAKFVDMSNFKLSLFCP